MKLNRINGKLTTSTVDIDKFITNNYLILPVKKIAHDLKKSYTFVKKRLDDLGLIIPIEIIEQRKKDSQLKKGCIAHNKGVKMRPDIYEKVKPTMFKKGNRTHNAYEKDGTISIRTEKCGKQYKHIRLSLGKWQLLHKYEYEKKNGNIPHGYCLWFKDGNSLNTEPSNIELITRGENVKRNRMKYLNYPEAILTTSKLINKLNKKIKNAESNN